MSDLKINDFVIAKEQRAGLLKKNSLYQIDRIVWGNFIWVKFVENNNQLINHGFYLTRFRKAQSHEIGSWKKIQENEAQMKLKV